MCTVTVKRGGSTGLVTAAVYIRLDSRSFIVLKGLVVGLKMAPAVAAAGGITCVAQLAWWMKRNLVFDLLRQLPWLKGGRRRRPLDMRRVAPAPIQRCSDCVRHGTLRI